MNIAMSKPRQCDFGCCKALPVSLMIRDAAHRNTFLCRRIRIGSTGGGAGFLVLLVLLFSFVTFATSADVNLGNLPLSKGFAIYGGSASDQSGWSVSAAGDVNADGFGDVIIGANRADVSGQADAGIAYVLFGRGSAMSGFQLPGPGTALATNVGFRILGALLNDNNACSVSKAGDINNDGVDDIIVGAALADPPSKSGAGITYVIFGRDYANGAMPFSDIYLTTGATSLSISIGFRILGFAANDRSGNSVSYAGDVNGDGFDDVIIGAYNANSAAGIAYVIFGRDVPSTANPFGDIYLPGNVMDSAVGFRILGAASNDNCGISVSAAGDINSDGVGDVIVGAKGADPASGAEAGISYVIFGRNLFAPGATPFGDIQLASGGIALDADTGFRILGAAAGDASGVSVSAAGDVNGDGIDDLLVGANEADLPSNGDAGIVYVIYGRDYTAPGFTNFFGDIQLTTGITALAAGVGFRILGATAGDFLGFSVRTAGDTNGDGISDIIIGAYAADLPIGGSTAGISYLIYGRDVPRGATPFSDIQLTTSAMSDTNGYRILGAYTTDQSGYSVSTAGDVNGDGMDDIIIGAFLADVGAVADAGTSYVLYGFNLYPTSQPSGQPSRQPSAQPSRQPSMQPSRQPSSQPSLQPSRQPTSQPSAQPSMQPSRQPTMQPSTQPSAQPTRLPSSQPTTQPSCRPTSRPSMQPSTQPSGQPSVQPSMQPSNVPSTQPSSQPSVKPSGQPSAQPTLQPSAQPSAQPSTQPSTLPTMQPSTQPSAQPSSQPSCQPTGLPSAQPSAQPSVQPSAQPTISPSAQPSTQPSSCPTVQPSSQPSVAPSAQPTSYPSAQPSRQPSSQPSTQPSNRPTLQTTTQPTALPSVQPSRQPSVLPSAQPMSVPSAQPIALPSTQPTSQPSTQPTSSPTIQPYAWPSSQPSSQPVSLPTSNPTVDMNTGEWVADFNNGSKLTTLGYAIDALWACESSRRNQFALQCSPLDIKKGRIVSQYLFQWTDITFVLEHTIESNVILAGLTISFASTTTDIAKCTAMTTQLYCTVQSFANMQFTAGSYVSFSNKNVYVGIFNEQAMVGIQKQISGVTIVYRYGTNKMASITLTQVESPPTFIGAFVAGACVSTALENHICTGMVRTDSGIMTMMYVHPANGVILNSAELVNAMTLEYVNPDSFIAGGLELSDGAGMHAYLVRVNTLYYSVLYGMRYRVSTHFSRRILGETSAYNSVVQGMVHADSLLYMVVNVFSTGTTNINNYTTILKVDHLTGQILQQVQIESQHAGIQCSDITETDLSFAMKCITTDFDLNRQPLLLSMDKTLTLSALPKGFRRYENNTLTAEPVLFRRTALPLSASVVENAYTEYSFNTADGYQTAQPTILPTNQPSSQPSSAPSGQPSSSPTSAPSVSPQPTSHPSTGGPTNTYKPTVKPTQRPSAAPTRVPSVSPSVRPSTVASARPSVTPSVASSNPPSLTPTTSPTRCPTTRPSRTPSMAHTTCTPTSIPTVSPTKRGRRVYEAYASMILGYVVGGLILLWCIYQLTLFALYKAEKVKADEKLMQEIRMIGLVPKPRHPVSRALLRGFMDLTPKEEDIVTGTNNVNAPSTEADGSAEVANNIGHGDVHSNALLSDQVSYSGHSNSDTSDSGSDILRHIIEGSAQNTEPVTAAPVPRGAYINSSNFVDLEANIITPEGAIAYTTDTNLIVSNVASIEQQARPYIVLNSLNLDTFSENSSEISNFIDRMLEQDANSESSSVP